MDAELKKKLLLVFEYLKINGCRYAEKEGDYYNMKFHDQNNQWSCVSQKSRNVLRLPIDIIKELEVLIDNHENEFDGFGEDPYGFEARLFPDSKTISIFELYSEYLTEDTQTATVDIEREPEVKEITDHYCKKEEICRGNITFQFYGGGDSGYIEDVGNSDFNGETKLYGPAEDMFYRMLNDFPGWEINEGSQGQCIIDMDLEQVQLDYGQNYEEQKEDEIWSMSLEDGINEDREKVQVTPSSVDVGNEDTMLSSVEKLLQVLYFDGLDITYDLRRIPHHHDKDYISLDIDIDVSRIMSRHENFDEKYANVVYDLESVLDTVEKYLGLSDQIYVGINYTNQDFLDNEALDATKELEQELKKSDFTTEQVNDALINIYYREDDYPFIKVEALGQDIPDERIELFEDTVWGIVKKYEHLSEIISEGELDWWINY
jgi:hypothetical protein